MRFLLHFMCTICCLGGTTLMPIVGMTTNAMDTKATNQQRITEKIAYYQSQAFKDRIAASTKQYQDPARLDRLINGKKYRRQAWQHYWREPLIAIDLPTSTPLTNPALTRRKEDGTYQLVLATKADAGGILLQSTIIGLQWLVYRALHTQAVGALLSVLEQEASGIDDIIHTNQGDTAQQAAALKTLLQAQCSYRSLSASMALRTAMVTSMQHLRTSVAMPTESIIERAYAVGLQSFLYTKNLPKAVQLGLNNLKSPQDFFKEASLKESLLMGTQWMNEWFEEQALVPGALTSWWWRSSSQLGVCVALTRWYLNQVVIPLVIVHLIAHADQYHEAQNMSPLQRHAILKTLVQESLKIPFGTWLAICHEHEVGLQLLAQLVPFCFGIYNAHHKLQTLRSTAQ